MLNNRLLIAGFFATMTAGLAATPTGAQPNLGIFARDPAAPLAGAMTEQQAREACRREMQGARESQASINRKMEICMRVKMTGN